MILNAIQNVKFYRLLVQIDQDLADQQRANGCPFCKAPLHSANYFRKPRGGPDNLSDDLLIRFSFCCSAESCRKRVMPTSCRFWDRKVYWGVIVLLAVVLQEKRTEGYCVSKIQRLLGISRLTLKRWYHYFKTVFPLSNRWKKISSLTNQVSSPDNKPLQLLLFMIKGFGEIVGLLKSLLLFSGDVMVF